MNYEALVWYIAAVPGLVIVIIVVLKATGRDRPRLPPAAIVLRRSEGVESASVDDAIRRMRKVIGLAERLAANGAVVADWMADWALYGCWSVTLQIPASPGAINPNSGKVLKAFWDGRGRYLSFEVQPSDPVRALDEYQQVHGCKGGKGDDPISTAEEYLTKLLRRPDEDQIGSDAHVAVARKLSAFAERIALRDIVLASLDCQCVGFESWSIDLYNGKNTDEARKSNNYVVRVKWNGASRDLSIEVSPLRRGRSPIEFQTELQQRLAPPDDPIILAERYLLADVRIAP